MVSTGPKQNRGGRAHSPCPLITTKALIVINCAGFFVVFLFVVTHSSGIVRGSGSSLIHFGGGVELEVHRGSGPVKNGTLSQERDNINSTVEAVGVRENIYSESQRFVEMAKESVEGVQPPTNPTDKVMTHMYEHLYGWFLFDLKRRRSKIKMLEIGLGCGAHLAGGYRLWTKLFPPPNEVWEAEYNKECVDEFRSKGLLDAATGIVTGDQKDPEVLRRWVNETGGNFDFIIDDGGHTNMQILNSFNVLFHEALKPGGLYFIEDLQVGRTRGYDDSKGEHIIADVIQEWVDQLLIYGRRMRAKDMPDQRAGQASYSHPLPAKVQSIHVQAEMAVIVKCPVQNRCPRWT